MAVTTEKDLPEFHRANWLKAMSAMQLKNHGYTIQLLQTVLASNPGFLAGRQLARKAAIARKGGKKNLLGGLSASSLGSLKIQARMGRIRREAKTEEEKKELVRDALEVVAEVEKALENDPRNPQLNNFLKEAALKADLPEVAAFALETVLDGSPKDTKTMHELASLHMAHGSPDKAVELYQRITSINPSDLAAVKGAKDAAAAASMMSGGWDREETTYRDLIKDKEQAVALEQQSRVVRSGEMIDNLLAELHAKAEAEPGQVDTARRIAELYEQKEDYENASTWFDYAAALTNHSDMALVRKASDLRIRQYVEAIEAREAYIEGSPGTPEAAAYGEELVDLRARLAELRLASAKTRVEQNPTDLQLRFELGEILVESGRHQEAIPELQRARQNPNVRIRAMSLLGRCFTERNMLDLAAKTLSEAEAELTAMDAVKKDLIYQLGLVHEKMGDKEKSIECMKRIYEVDYGYRDVAGRVEGSY
jgi:tetratricopeptide (TPR) repeat protein